MRFQIGTRRFPVITSVLTSCYRNGAGTRPDLPKCSWDAARMRPECSRTETARSPAHQPDINRTSTAHQMHIKRTSNAHQSRSPHHLVPGRLPPPTGSRKLTFRCSDLLLPECEWRVAGAARMEVECSQNAAAHNPHIALHIKPRHARNPKRSCTPHTKAQP